MGETINDKADRIMADYWEVRNSPQMGAVSTDFDKGFMRAKHCSVCGADEATAAYQNDEAIGWFCAECDAPWPVREEEMTKGSVQIDRDNRSVEKGMHRTLEISIQYSRLLRKVSVGEMRAYIALCHDFTAQDLREAPELFEGVDMSDEGIVDVQTKVRGLWVDCLLEIGTVR